MGDVNGTCIAGETLWVSGWENCSKGGAGGGVGGG